MFQENLSQFFDTDDFAVPARITGAGGFDRTVSVIFNNPTKEIAVYSETQIESPEFNFLAQESDLAGVKKGMTATVNAVAYKVERIERDGDGLATCYLSK